MQLPNKLPNKSPTKKKIVNNFLKEEQQVLISTQPNFLQEPVLANGLVVDFDNIARLRRDAWLTTTFIDYLIKYGCEGCKENNIIVPTSASDSLLAVLSRLSASKKPGEIETFE